MNPLVEIDGIEIQGLSERFANFETEKPVNLDENVTVPIEINSNGKTLKGTLTAKMGEYEEFMRGNKDV